jgi:hypothetical protein
MRLMVPSLFVLLVAGGIALVAQTTKPAEVPTNAKDRRPHPATQPNQVLDMSVAELGNFDFDPEAKDPEIPDDVKAMSGVTIRLHGFMVPIDLGESLTRFALVPKVAGPDGPAPKIQNTALVTCTKGMSVKYSSDEIIVQGKLMVGVVKDDSFIVSIFAVEASSVKPAPK